MTLIEEIKNTLIMEIRPNSQGLEYLEAVINKKDLRLLISLLNNHLGQEVKGSGKELNLPEEIQEIIDTLGGLQLGQSGCKNGVRSLNLLFGMQE